MKELQLQYDVQVDVVTQLEDRVKQQLNSAQSSAPQIVKLKRDFERVQARVQSSSAPSRVRRRATTPARCAIWGNGRACAAEAAGAWRCVGAQFTAHVSD